MKIWENILIGLDNSMHSLWGSDLAITLAHEIHGVKLTGCHVYAVKLHDERFKAMEYTLPEKYLSDAELERQREVHSLLIGKGMQVISDSYMDVVRKKSEDKGVDFSSLSLEGKNYKELVGEINKGEYDLAVLGLLGVGQTEASKVGSVALRSARRVRKDLLIVKNDCKLKKGEKIMVCIDGSTHSFAALDLGINLAKSFKLSLILVSVFDPHLHGVIFRNISKVLSKEGAEIFKFKEQEELHDGIIDDGLAKIYQSHLNVAEQITTEAGVKTSTKLLSGKAQDELVDFAKETKPTLIIAGRVGIHKEDDSDIGGVTESLLFNAPANLLITSREKTLPEREIIEETLKWTAEALELMKKAPSFVLPMAKGAIEKYALEKGHTVITSAVMEEVLSDIMPAHLKKLIGVKKKTETE